MAYVLVQHLDPHHESILAEILVRTYYQAGHTQQAYVRREWNKEHAIT